MPRLWQVLEDIDGLRSLPDLGLESICDSTGTRLGCMDLDMPTPFRHIHFRLWPFLIFRRFDIRAASDRLPDDVVVDGACVHESDLSMSAEEHSPQTFGWQLTWTC